MFLVEKIKDATQNFFKGIFRFWYLKIKYPIYYRLRARCPVDARKVVFIENRFPTLTSSFALIHGRILREYDCVVKDCFLLEKEGTRREYDKRCMAMIREVANAKYVFVDDSSRVVGALPFRPETYLTQLWHACGAFKKWGFSNAEGKFGATHRQMRRYPYYAKYNLMTVSSEEVRWAYSEAFGLPPENDVVRATGVSRTDVFFDPAFRASAYETLYEKIPQARGKKVILYAPTFRGTVGRARPPKNLRQHVLFEQLGEGYVLIYKQHPSVKKKTFLNEALADKVFDMTQEMSIEQLLTVSDVCVTDYSSVIFEYSLFARPILIYAFDYEEYTDWRGFYYPFAEFVPGPIVKNTQELADCIKNLDHYDLQKVRDFCKKYMGACDGHATDRILDAVFGEELPKRSESGEERA